MQSEYLSQKWSASTASVILIYKQQLTKEACEASFSDLVVDAKLQVCTSTSNKKH